MSSGPVVPHSSTRWPQSFLPHAGHLPPLFTPVPDSLIMHQIVDVAAVFQHFLPVACCYLCDLLTRQLDLVSFRQSCSASCGFIRLHIPEL